MTDSHETITALANTATYGGAGTAVLFGLSANEFAITQPELIVDCFEWLKHDELDNVIKVK